MASSSTGFVITYPGANAEFSVYDNNGTLITGPTSLGSYYNIMNIDDVSVLPNDNLVFTIVQGGQALALEYDSTGTSLLQTYTLSANNANFTFSSPDVGGIAGLSNGEFYAVFLADY